MQRLSNIRDWLGRRAEEVLALVLASLFVTFLIQIVFRYVLNLPLGWTIEYVSIAWLLKFVASNKFTGFIWYRVALGVVIIALVASNVVTA